MLEWVALAWLLLWVFRRRCSFWNGQNATYRVVHSMFHISLEYSDASIYIYKVFNPLILWRRNVLGVWFNLGVYFMGFGQVASSILLLYFTTTLVAKVVSMMSAPSGTNGSSVNGSTTSIVPLIPGVNLPMDYLFVFWIATFIALAVHELGHAAAAAMERLQIQGFGVFFAFLFPGAYVRIEESLHYIPMWSQLKVYSAGVWHNITLTIVCLLLVPSLPVLLSWGFSPAAGAMVSFVPRTSTLHRSIDVGDMITALNGVPVGSATQLHDILQSITLSLDKFKVPNPTTTKLRSRWAADGQRSEAAEQRWSLQKQEILHMPGYCATRNVIERLSAAMEADDPLRCCKQVIAPWLLKDDQDVSFHTCFAHGLPVGDSFVAPKSGHTPPTPETKLRGGSPSEDRKFLRQNREQAKAAEDDMLGGGEGAAVDSTAVRWWRNRHGQVSVSEKTESDAGSTLTSSAPASTSTLHCLAARGLVEDTTRQGHLKCETDADCSNPLSAESRERICLRPLTTFPESIMIISLGSGKTVLFEGSPTELISSFEVTDYTLRVWLKRLVVWKWLYSKALSFPGSLRILILLCAQISLSVAVLNMMPVQYFDGGHACKQFARILFPRHWRQISDVVIKVANGLLMANLLSSIIPLVIKIFQDSKLGEYLPMT